MILKDKPKYKKIVNKLRRQLEYLQRFGVIYAKGELNIKNKKQYALWVYSKLINNYYCIIEDCSKETKEYYYVSLHKFIGLDYLESFCALDKTEITKTSSTQFYLLLYDTSFLKF